jgi:hypothetical protein
VNWRRLVGWVIRLDVLVGLIVALARGAGWNWPGAIILAVVAVPVAEFAVRITLINIRLRRDGGRGLAVREWRAITILGNCAEKSDRASFNQFTMSRLKRTDPATLIGYATILTHLLIVERSGPQPSDAQIDSLAAESAEKWQAVMRRQSTVLNELLREARDYRRDGLPEPTWENCRAMIAAAGVLRHPHVAHRKPMRYQVAYEYEALRAAASQAPADTQEANPPTT